jgi:hypothetical protein
VQPVSASTEWHLLHDAQLGGPGGVLGGADGGASGGAAVSVAEAAGAVRWAAARFRGLDRAVLLRLALPATPAFAGLRYIMIQSYHSLLGITIAMRCLYLRRPWLSALAIRGCRLGPVLPAAAMTALRPTLRALDLADNRLIQLGGALLGMAALRRLDLARNKVPPGAHRSLRDCSQ